MDRVVAVAQMVLTVFRMLGKEEIKVDRIHAVIQTVLTETREL